MNVIFDENVPWPLRRFVENHTVTSVQREGWAGTKNGRLLDLIDGDFDVFVIADRNIRYQQNLEKRVIAIVELPSNRWPILRKISAEISESIDRATPSSYTVVEFPPND